MPASPPVAQTTFAAAKTTSCVSSGAERSSAITPAAAASPFSMRVSRRTARWRSQTGIFASVTRFSSASVMYLDVYGPADVPRLMGS